MLVLSRKKNESIVINGNIRIEVLQIKGKQIRLGITAPSSMKVLRGELPPGGKSGQKTDTKTETQVADCDLHSFVAAMVTA